MIYYLNNNFRSEDNYKLNGYEIIQSLGANITTRDEEDIIYLLASSNEENNGYKSVKIYFMRWDNKHLEELSIINESIYNPKIKVIAFNNRRINTVMLSFDSEKKEKNIRCYTFYNDAFKETFNSNDIDENEDINIIKKEKRRFIIEYKKNSYTIYRKDQRSLPKNKIIDFRLAYNLEMEDYSLILLKSIEGGLVKEMEFILDKEKFINKSSKVIVI